jgi:predicted dinucleotide-binding enzyme
LLEEKNIRAYPVAEAVSKSEVLLLSVPPDVIPAVARNLSGVEEKILIDPSNAFRGRPEGYANGFEALTHLTRCRHLVKAFNNTGYENMAHPAGLDTFVAGDSEQAKTVVKQLAEDLGFAHCYDFGGSDMAPLLEQLGMAWINLALIRGLGRNIALNVIGI